MPIANTGTFSLNSLYTAFGGITPPPVSFRSFGIGGPSGGLYRLNSGFGYASDGTYSKVPNIGNRAYDFGGYSCGGILLVSGSEVQCNYISGIDFFSYTPFVCGAKISLARSESVGVNDNSGNYGYVAGGMTQYSSSQGFTTLIEKFITRVEVMDTSTFALSTGRQGMSGLESSTKGYFFGGASSSGGVYTYYNTIESILFSTGTTTALAATLSETKQQTGSATNYGTASWDAGYIFGGYAYNAGTNASTYSTLIDKFTFTSETLTNTGTTLDASGIARQASTKSYSLAYQWGGHNNSGLKGQSTSLSTIKRFDLNTNTMNSDLTALQVCEYGAGASNLDVSLVMNQVDGIFVSSLNIGRVQKLDHNTNTVSEPCWNNNIMQGRGLVSRAIKMDGYWGSLSSYGISASAFRGFNTYNGYIFGGLLDNSVGYGTNTMDAVSFHTAHFRTSFISLAYIVSPYGGMVGGYYFNAAGLNGQYAGYFGGGYVNSTQAYSTSTMSNEVRKLQFITETWTRVLSTVSLESAKVGLVGFSNWIKGYFYGGYNSGGTLSTTGTGFTISTETSTAVSATLANGRNSMARTTSAAYAHMIGGSTGYDLLSNEINTFTYATEAIATAGTTLSNARDRMVGLSSANTAYICGGGYTAGNYYLKMIERATHGADLSFIQISASMTYGHSFGAGLNSPNFGIIAGGANSGSAVGNAPYVEYLSFVTNTISTGASWSGSPKSFISGVQSGSL